MQKKILKRMKKEWGMHPVLPGYSGMILQTGFGKTY
ncbi:MAG: alpha-N-acetylglucosaminidase TIM-barrel domain-containing protein [Phocaeicola vulgatus]